MTIREVYTLFKNPPSLQKHMLSVAKIASFIADHWTRSEIDRDLLMKVSLLHDIGNIVKFDIQKYPHLLGEEEHKRVDYWMKIQKETIEKYGTDDHEVTGKMLAEAKVDPEITQTVLDMSYPNAPKIAESDNYILKILLYSDLRVSPTGIIPIKERLDEVHSRLAKYKDRIDLYHAGLKIEKQIQEKVNVNLAEITDETINSNEHISKIIADFINEQI